MLTRFAVLIGLLASLSSGCSSGGGGGGGGMSGAPDLNKIQSENQHDGNACPKNLTGKYIYKYDVVKRPDGEQYSSKNIDLYLENENGVLQFKPDDEASKFIVDGKTHSSSSEGVNFSYLGNCSKGVFSIFMNANSKGYMIIIYHFTDDGHLAEEQDGHDGSKSLKEPPTTYERE
jgi:hypothetical protein